MDNRRFGLPSCLIKADGLYIWNKFTASTSNAASPARVQTLTAAVANDEAQPGLLKHLAVSNAVQYDTVIRIRVWDKAVVDAAPTPAGDPVYEVTLETSSTGTEQPVPVEPNVHLFYGAIIKVEGLGVGQALSIGYSPKAKRKIVAPVDNFAGSTRLIQ